MDATTVQIITTGIAALATITAVLVAHVLNQKAGEKRANQVREELISRIDTLGVRVAEFKTDLSQRISDLKSDMGSQALQLRSEITAQAVQIRSDLGQVRSDVDRSSDRTKEAVVLEIRALKAELLSGIQQQRSRAAGDVVS